MKCVVAVKGRMQWHAVVEGHGEETCRGWIGRRPKVGEMGKTRQH